MQRVVSASAVGLRTCLNPSHTYSAASLYIVTGIALYKSYYYYVSALEQCTLHAALKPDNMTTSSARNQASHPCNIVCDRTDSWRFNKLHADWCLLERHLRDLTPFFFAVGYIIIIIDHFYIALFSALEQTHCARM